MAAPGLTGTQLTVILRGLGLSPSAFSAIINNAVRFQWTPEEFEARVYLSKPFQRTFPGIVREDGSLRMSPVEYRQVADAYRKVGENYEVPLDSKRIGLLIQGNRSPQEFQHIAEVFRAAVNSDALRVRFNEQLKASGKDALTTRGWFETLAGKGDAEVQDLYEAARLQAAGLDITAQTAAVTARRVGAPGEEVDIASVIADLQKQKRFVGAELAAAGVTDADLAVLASGEDPNDQRGTVEQVWRNRQALAERPVAISRQRTAPGRAALFPTVQETA